METKVFPLFSLNPQFVWLCGVRSAAWTMHIQSNVQCASKCVGNASHCYVWVWWATMAFTFCAEISWGCLASTAYDNDGKC